MGYNWTERLGGVSHQEGFRSWIEGDIISIEGNLPKGVECSWKYSVAQARRAMADALKDVLPVAQSMSCEYWYPIGPNGFGASNLKCAISLFY